MLNIQVESKIFGSKDNSDKRFEPVVLELASERIEIRELIYRTVKEQIEHHIKKLKKDHEVVRAMFQRQYLSKDEIDRQSKEGAVNTARKKDTQEKILDIDIEKEFQKAINCFNGNTYKLLVDGETMDDLNEIITLTPKTKIVFIRLTPLVGG